MCLAKLTYFLKKTNIKHITFVWCRPWKQKPMQRNISTSFYSLEKQQTPTTETPNANATMETPVTETPTTETPKINESDCCGNGCANCILDMAIAPTVKKSIYANRKNIVSNYKRFNLLSKKFHTNQLTNILDLHFSCVLDKTETPNDYILDIPTGYHIMMRAPENSQQQQQIVNNNNNNKSNKNNNNNNSKNNEINYILRPYSPYWIDILNFEFKIVVNLQPNGPMSKYIEKLKAGDSVEFRGPLGRFAHNPADKKSVVIVSQGIAIAPAFPIINEILENKDDMSKIYHFCCFQNIEHIYFRNYMQEFNKYWNYKSYIYLAHEFCDKDECKNAGQCAAQCENFRKKLRYMESVKTERLTAKEILDTCKDFGDDDNDVLVICGSRNFQDFMEISMRKYKPFLRDANVFLL